MNEETTTYDLVEVGEAKNPAGRLSREDLLKRGRDAFKRKLESERRDLDDDLIGPFSVFPMTLTEKHKIYEDYKKARVLSLARVVVVRAKFEDGRRLFRDADAVLLAREWDSEDVERIASKIQEDAEDEDAEAVAATAEGTAGN